MKRMDLAMATVMENKGLRAHVYCPICSHTVEAQVAVENRPYRKVWVIEGQKCRRCSALLDAAYVLDALGAMN
mgnify:FL=1